LKAAWRFRSGSVRLQSESKPPTAGLSAACACRFQCQFWPAINNGFQPHFVNTRSSASMSLGRKQVFEGNTGYFFLRTWGLGGLKRSARYTMARRTDRHSIIRSVSSLPNVPCFLKRCRLEAFTLLLGDVVGTGRLESSNADLRELPNFAYGSPSAQSRTRRP
jgi:hypothetical protein